MRVPSLTLGIGNSCYLGSEVAVPRVGKRVNLVDTTGGACLACPLPVSSWGSLTAYKLLEEVMAMHLLLILEASVVPQRLLKGGWEMQLMASKLVPP